MSEKGGMAYADVHHLMRLERIEKAATSLFQAESEGCGAHVSTPLIADLGEALHGENDSRVKAMRPRPKFRVGDWVTYFDGHRSGGTNLVIEVAKDGAPITWEQGRSRCVCPADVRLATPEEITKARGEAVEEKATTRYLPRKDEAKYHCWYVDKHTREGSCWPVATCREEVLAQMICDALNAHEAVSPR